MPHVLHPGGRLAGVLYLIVVVTGIFCLAYVPAQLAGADAGALLDNVVARQALFKQGVAAFVVEQVAYLLLALVLYRAFQDVSRGAATLMLAFVAMGVPLALAALSHRLQALALLTDADSAQLLSPEQRQQLAHAALKAYRGGMQLVRVFWAGWCCARDACRACSACCWCWAGWATCWMCWRNCWCRATRTGGFPPT